MNTLITFISVVAAITLVAASSQQQQEASQYSLMSATGGVEMSMPSSTDPSCGWSYTPSGQPSINWDLSPMIKTQGDYEGSDTAYSYKANVCAASNAGPGCTDKDFSICQYKAGEAGATSLGSFTAQAPAWSLITKAGQDPEPPSAGLMYTMTNGDKCFIAGQETERKVQNVFRCAQTASNTITVVEDGLTCIFTITYQSPQACGGATPTPSSTGGGSVTVSVGLSGGWVFIIILLVVVPLYITIGCVYRVKKGGAAFGRDACPQSAFWCAIPGYTKDGFKFVFNLIKSGCKSGHSSETYNQI